MDKDNYKDKKYIVEMQINNPRKTRLDVFIRGKARGNRAAQSPVK